MSSEDEPMSRREAQELRQAITSATVLLTDEFKTFRTESTQTFVRQDTHQLNLELLTAAHNRDVALLTQTLTALKESVDTRMGNVEGDVEKINSDSDWLKKLVYSTIVMAVLGLLGLTGAASSGLLGGH